MLHCQTATVRTVRQRLGGKGDDYVTERRAYLSRGRTTRKRKTVYSAMSRKIYRAKMGLPACTRAIATAKRHLQKSENLSAYNS